jgi:hypothetical protein
MERIKMALDQKTLAILALSVSAAVLLLANFGGKSAHAETVISDRDYQLMTGRSGNGGDDLYVMDNRSGLLACFIWDPSVRALRPRGIASVPNIFNSR